MSPRAFDDLDDTADGPEHRDRRRRPPADSQYRAPEADNILRRVIDIIESSPGMPMSASVRVNKDEVLELLEDAVSRLPDELRSARWLLKEREDYLERARRESDELISQARSRVAHMSQRSEVVKAAEARAAQIVEDAEASARRLRLETEDYCDQKLASFENVLAKVAKTVATGRQRLSGPGVEAALGEPARGQEPRPERDPRRERGGGPGRSPVFDQDR